MVSENNKSPRDGSQTERGRGTYSGRQRWLSKSTKSPLSTSRAIVSTNSRYTKGPRVTGPAVNTFLSSLGVNDGDENELVQKEANEVSQLRRDFDTMKSKRLQKEKIYNQLLEKLHDLETTHHSQKNDVHSAKQNKNKLEHRTERTDEKLEKEIMDNGVYKHMIERLTSELHAIKKHTLEQEQSLQGLDAEIQTNSTTLLAARQEKALAEHNHQELLKDMEIKRDDHQRALRDLTLAVVQAKKKGDILQRREASRQQVMAQAMGEMTMKESKKLRLEQYAQKSTLAQIHKDMALAEAKLAEYEKDFHKIVEASGTMDANATIIKYNGLNDTLATLKNEFVESEARMKALKERNLTLIEGINHRRSMVTNARGVYHEMDRTANKLQEMEKEAVAMSEKYNKINVVLDSFRSCMMKCWMKMESVRGVNDFGQEKQEIMANEAPTIELIHIVEQKLNRVIDTINRERAELDLHRAEANQGLRRAESTERLLSIRTPLLNESEEHFILRMSAVDTSPGNLRVGPNAVRGGKTTVQQDDNGPSVDAEDIDDAIIDRTTRKQLANMVLNREKRNRKPKKGHY